MSPEQQAWLADFARKLTDAADRAEDRDAKAILMAKAGTANFIRERLEEMS